MSRLAATIAAAALILVACGDSGDELPGSSWVVDSVAGEAPPGDVVATLDVVDESSVTAYSGCNSFMGAYSVDGDRISIGPLAGTLIACPEPLMSFESAYTAALQSAERFERDGDRLRLSSSSGEALVTFERFEPQLEGEWDVVSYNDGATAVVSVIGGSEITATFVEGGEITGFAGCNTYFGAWEADGDRIAIDGLGSTEIFCEDPPGVMDQELRYLDALGTSTSWSLLGTTLTLRADDGTTQVVLVTAG